MHLEIKQANDRTEQVSSTCIDKLYNLSKNSLLDATSDLRGNINATSAYEDAVTFLNTMWGPNLIVTASAYYIRFVDPEVESVLKTALNKGEDEGITTQEAAVANIGTLFRNNTEITSFDEFPYFTAQQSRGTSFTGCTALTRIDISSCSVISGGMLSGCTMLEYFNGPGSDRGVLTVPHGVTIINSQSFRHLDKMTKLVLPDTVTTIGMNACDWNTALDEVVFGTGSTTIGRDAFEHNNSLTKVRVPSIETWFNITFASGASNPLYYAGHLYVNDTEVTALTIPDGTTTIGNYLFAGGVGFQTISIPQSVVSIGAGAFQECSSAPINEINFPNLTTLGSYAFSKTKVQTVSDLGSITSIPDGCFSECYQLTSVIIPNIVTSIGNRAFSGCSGLTSVTIPSSVTSIGNDAFRDCSSLTSVTIPNSLTSIGSWCFLRTSLSTVVLPNSITTLGAGCFSNITTLTSIILSNNLTAIPEDCFEYCRTLSSITIPSSVTSIGSEAFQTCTSLQSLDLPGVVSIDVHAFLYSSIKTLNIGPSFTTVARESSTRNGFAGMGSLTTVKIEAATPPTLTVKPFPNSYLQHIYVPSSSVNAYKTATGWSEWASIIEAIPTT